MERKEFLQSMQFPNKTGQSVAAGTRRRGRSRALAGVKGPCERLVRISTPQRAAGFVSTTSPQCIARKI